MLTDGRFQMSETQCARQSCAEEIESSSSKFNICDRRRRKFLVDRENSRSNRMKQEATSEIVEELLNLSQSEISEKEHSSRVFLQMDLIAENRSNRDQLVASECELNAERLNIWKDIEVTREIEWVVKQRILAQLGNFRDLEESRKAASDDRSVLAANATLLRVKQLNNWVKSCNNMGLYPPSEDISLDFLASAKRDTEVISDLNDLKISTEEGAELSRAHSIFLSDAKIMYSSPLMIPKPLPKVEDLHLFEDLPYTISEHLSQVDVKWLLSEVLETQDMMPTADPSTCVHDKLKFKDRSLEGIWSRKVSFVKSIDYSLISSPPPPTNNLLVPISAAHVLDGMKDSWGSNYRSAMAEHLAVNDFNDYVLDIGNTDTGTVTDVDNDNGKLLRNSAPSASEVPVVIPLTHQPKRRGSVVSAEVEDVCPSPENVVHAPSWLLTTPAKHLLGAVIVAVRCATATTAAATAATSATVAAAITAAPIITAGAPRVEDSSKLESNVEQMDLQACDVSSVVVTATDADFTYKAESADPESMAPSINLAQHSFSALNSVEKSIPVFSVRLALCGACDLTKKAISNAISVLSGGGVRVISVDRLLSQAVARAREIASDSTKSYQTALSESEDSTGYEYDDEQHLGVRALKILLAGKCIPDDMYVSLLINAINELVVDMRERAAYSTGDRTEAQGDAVTGYILEDFPNTKQQASLLVNALSGVDYDSHKPQPADHASRFAPIAPYKISVHDNALCGLDKVLYLDATMESSLSEISSARKNTVTNEVVHFPFGETDRPIDFSYMASNITHGNTHNSNQLHLKDLEEIDNSSSSRHTSFFDIALTASAGEDLKAFLSKIGVLIELHSADYTTRNEYINAAIEILYRPAGRVGVTDQPASRVNNVTSCDPDPSPKLYGLMDTLDKNEDDALHESKSQSQRETAVIASIESSTIPLPVPAPILSYTTLPPQLATALSGMWDTAENNSIIVGRMFFKTLRDYRYQMIQRRRVMYDALRLLQVRLDNRQDLFEDFIVGFNQIDDDFRFDTDCVAELHLRTLELRESILSGCDVRKKDAESFVSTVSLDGIHHLLCHMSECEGAAMIQAEYNRFIVSIHLLLDYSKSMASYDSTKRILNVLEETLQASVLDDSSTSSIAAKDGRKSHPSTNSGIGSGTGTGSGPGSGTGVITKKQQPVRKGSQNQTLLEPEIYRVPVPVISLPFGAMSEHPRQVALADTVDDDARTVTTKSHSHRGKTDVRLLMLLFDSNKL